MSKVLTFPCADVNSARTYARPPLQWITRRARRLQRAYGVSRRLAIFDAWRDYIDFTGTNPLARRGLIAFNGGLHRD